MRHLLVVVILGTGSLSGGLALGTGQSDADALIHSLTFLDREGSLILSGLGAGEAGITLPLACVCIGLGALGVEASLL
jgi:hypothetical protein